MDERMQLFIVFYIITSIFALAMGTACLVDSLSNNYYEGKLTFTAEEEYVQFKDFIGQNKVEIQDLKVASSSPPIVVQYKLKMPQYIDFPYGLPEPNYNYIAGFIAFAFIFGISMFLIATEKKN